MLGLKCGTCQCFVREFYGLGKVFMKHNYRVDSINARFFCLTIMLKIMRHMWTTLTECPNVLQVSVAKTLLHCLILVSYYP